MVQTCTFCKNHDIVQPKKKHKLNCDYGSVGHWKECPKCLQTRERQISVAREKKLDYKMQVKSSIALDALDIRKRVTRMCRKCKRHGQSVVSNKRHDDDCPYIQCPCEACAITDIRRKHVRYDLKQSRLQTKLQNKSPVSPSVSTDSGFYSPGCPTSPSESFVDLAVSQAEENCETHNVLLATTSFWKSHDNEQIQRDADMLIDQLDNEASNLLDSDAILSNDQLNELLSELDKLSQPTQQYLFDGCIDPSWTY